MTKDEKKSLQWFATLFQNKNEKKRKPSFQYLMLVLCLGLGLMVIGSLLTNDEEDGHSQPVFHEENSDEDEPTFGRSSPSEDNGMETYEIHYENQLKESLEQIVGISDVTVMINLAESERRVYETNTNTRQQNTDETDREGGTRKVDDLSRDEQVVIVRKGDQEEPVLIRTEKPQIRGVLIVAQGVERAEVKGWVVEAVSRVLDVPAHRVSVMPKKSKEE